MIINRNNRYEYFKTLLLIFLQDIPNLYSLLMNEYHLKKCRDII